MNSENNNNKISRSVSAELTLAYEKELSTILHNTLVNYVKQQNKLNDFLIYDEEQIKAYFLEEITDIFQNAVRNACKMYAVATEDIEKFLRNNWGRLGIDELIGLINTYVHDLSPLAVETSTKRAKQFKKLRQEFLRDIIDNWFVIIDLKTG